MTKSIFTGNRFTATQCFTAEEKARFCTAFVRFVISGFTRRLFKHEFYRRLSNIFGHIANYDDTGFWEVWFSSPDRQRQFVQRIHEWVPVGDPHFCWVDVERELKSWAAREADAIEAVLTANEWKSAEAARRKMPAVPHLPTRPTRRSPSWRRAATSERSDTGSTLWSPTTAVRGRCIVFISTRGRPGRSSTSRW